MPGQWEQLSGALTVLDVGVVTRDAVQADVVLWRREHLRVSHAGERVTMRPSTNSGMNAGCRRCQSPATRMMSPAMAGHIPGLLEGSLITRDFTIHCVWAGEGRRARQMGIGAQYQLHHNSEIHQR